MTTVARRDPADKAKIDAIEKKLLANPDIAKLIDDLGTSTTCLLYTSPSPRD